MSEQPKDPGTIRDSENDLQDSSEVFLAELERVRELENKKRSMSPGTEARAAVAREIEDLTLDLVARSRYQSRLVELQDRSVDASDAAPRSPSVILEEWREAERRLHEARSAMERASDDADRLRDEHRRSARRGQR